MVACCKRCLPIGFWLVVSLYWDDDPQTADDCLGKGTIFPVIAGQYLYFWSTFPWPTSLHWGQGRLRVHRGLPGCWMSCSCCCGGRWWCISWFSKCFWLNLYVFPCFSSNYKLMDVPNFCMTVASSRACLHQHVCFVKLSPIPKLLKQRVGTMTKSCRNPRSHDCQPGCSPGTFLGGTKNKPVFFRRIEFHKPGGIREFYCI